MLLSDDQVTLAPLGQAFVDFITDIRTDWNNYGFFFEFHLATREQEAEWIAHVIRDSSQANFVILGSGRASEPLGTISLTDIDRRSRNAQYGRLYIATQHRGSGIAKRASRLVLDYAFRELNLRRVYLRVLSSNDRAIRLYQDLGFKDEGCLRRHIFKNGNYEDVTLMALFSPHPDT